MSEETKYTYYRIDFINCHSIEFDYMIVADIMDIENCIAIVDTDLDDPEAVAEVRITGVGMTREQYDQYLKHCDNA